ncbi:MAG: hypothetical protein H6Q05_3004 [Acidobacteria bacterium]|nr:hypothetical protein [Acidobacteriota bacterium]
MLEDIASMDAFQRAPWNSGCLQGIVDAPFLTLTPGTRSGILRDEQFDALCRALKLRYICRLYVKELVHSNFPGPPAERLLERMVELSLYTEEHLK